MIREIEIEKILYGGDGLARLDGKVVFVPFSAPGDTAMVEITETNRDFCRGRIRELVRKGPGRTAPACPHFGQCGGCNLQHLDYATQMQCKKLFLTEALERIAKTSAPDFGPILCGPPWQYRNRVQWKFENRPDEFRFGFFERESNRIVGVDECPLLAPPLNRIRSRAEEKARGTKAPRGEIEAVCDSKDRVEFGEERDGTPLLFHVLEKQLLAGADVFFQCNRFLLDSLVSEAVGSASGKTAWDLYAGVGLFSAFLCDRFESVWAVEANTGARPYFVGNAPGAHLATAPVEQWINAGQKRPDLVIVDPPRAGLARFVLEALAKASPAVIVYVSCNPSTLGRDLRLLRETGYRLESIRGLDLFPQTFHIESVARLVRQ